MAVRPRTLCGVVAISAGLVTLAVAVHPGLGWAYHAPSARVAIETAAALIAVVVAYIFIGRFLRSRRLDHLGVAAGLLTLAASNAISAVNVSAGGWDPLPQLAWGASLAGIVVIAVAAFLPDTRVVRSGRGTAATLGACVALALLFAASLDVLFEAFPREPDLASLDPTRPHLSLHAVFLIASAVAVLGLAAAAIGFARDAERRPDDPLLTWLAVATIVGAFGRLHSFLFPPVQEDWVYTGTLFRLAFYLVLLAGAAIEVERYWRGLAKAAVLEERRRIARDLHDGVAQELAFIDRASRRLASGGRDGAAHQIAAAAQRGLADSRRAIAALTRPLDEPLEDVLAQATEDVAARTGLDLSFDLARGVRLDPARREALIRIACEAVTNAAVHGRAHGVRIELSNGRGVRMRVVDDGVGFDPAAVRGKPGFGLVSMRERAEAVGAAFRLRARPGRGTAVEVELP